MKKLLLLAIVAASIFACKNKTGVKKDAKTELEKKITKRDLSITPANAYNDIFLDSLAMEKFIVDTKQHDSITRRMRSFYNARNYQYAWFASDGLTEQARGFWNLETYYATIKKDTGLNFKILTGLMDKLETVDKLNVSTVDKNILTAEFLLTSDFINYILSNYQDGVVKRKELERFIPLVKRDALIFADSLLTKKHKDNKYYEDNNAAYKALKQKLEVFYIAQKNGGWLPINTGKISFKSGMASPYILQIKKTTFCNWRNACRYY